MAPTARSTPGPAGDHLDPRSTATSCVGQFVELVPARRIVFTFGWERADVGVPPGPPPSRSTSDRTSGGTSSDLVHRGLAGPMADAHTGGWTNYLARLATVAEGRDPGPDPLAAERVPTAARLGIGMSAR